MNDNSINILTRRPQSCAILLLLSCVLWCGVGGSVGSAQPSLPAALGTDDQRLPDAANLSGTVYVAATGGTDGVACGGSTATACASLAYAVAQRAAPGAQVRLLAGTHTLLATVALPRSVSIIDAPGAPARPVVTTHGASRVLHALGATTTVTIEGIEVADGRAAGSGAGLLADGVARVVLRGVVFRNNTIVPANASVGFARVDAAELRSIGGAGVYVAAASVQVDNSAFVDNDASLCACGPDTPPRYSFSPEPQYRCSHSNRPAGCPRGAGGGGALLRHWSPSGAPAAPVDITVSGCNFTGNWASIGAGLAVAAAGYAGGVVAVADSSFQRNLAPSYFVPTTLGGDLDCEVFDGVGVHVEVGNSTQQQPGAGAPPVAVRMPRLSAAHNDAVAGFTAPSGYGKAASVLFSSPDARGTVAINGTLHDSVAVTAPWGLADTNGNETALHVAVAGQFVGPYAAFDASDATNGGALLVAAGTPLPQHGTCLRFPTRGDLGCDLVEPIDCLRQPSALPSVAGRARGGLDVAVNITARGWAAQVLTTAIEEAVAVRGGAVAVLARTAERVHVDIAGAFANNSAWDSGYHDPGVGEGGSVAVDVADAPFGHVNVTAACHDSGANTGGCVSVRAVGNATLAPAGSFATAVRGSFERCLALQSGAVHIDTVDADCDVSFVSFTDCGAGQYMFDAGAERNGVGSTTAIGGMVGALSVDASGAGARATLSVLLFSRCYAHRVVVSPLTTYPVGTPSVADFGSAVAVGALSATAARGATVTLRSVHVAGGEADGNCSCASFAAVDAPSRVEAVGVSCTRSRAAGSGGGVCVTSYAADGGDGAQPVVLRDMSVTDNVIVPSSADAADPQTFGGGGVAVFGGAVLLANSTIEGNEVGSGGSGGGVYVTGDFPAKLNAGVCSYWFSANNPIGTIGCDPHQAVSQCHQMSPNFGTDGERWNGVCTGYRTWEECDTQLTLSNVSVARNTAMQGGGVAAFNALLRIESGSVLRNTAQNVGGGLYVAGFGPTVLSAAAIVDNVGSMGADGAYIASAAPFVQDGSRFEQSAPASRSRSVVEAPDTGPWLGGQWPLTQRGPRPWSPWPAAPPEGELRCPAGTFVSVGASELLAVFDGWALPMTFVRATASCVPCDRGYTSAWLYNASAPRSVALRVQSFRTECARCPAGSFAADVGSTACTPVSAGHTAEGSGTAQQTPCPPGWYAASATRCAPCPPGTSNRRYAAAACERCPASTYAPGDGSVACTPCSAGTYSAAVAGATSCEPCPRGALCASGGTNASSPLRAAPGFWGNVAGFVRAGGNASAARLAFYGCPAGYCCGDAGACGDLDGCIASRRGVLCGACDEGMSAVVGTAACRRDDDCNDAATFTAALLLGALAYAFVMFVRSRRAMMRITAQFFQVSALLVADDRSKVRAFVFGLFDWQLHAPIAASGGGDDGGGGIAAQLPCLAPGMTSVGKQALRLALPLSVVCVFLPLLYVVSARSRQLRRCLRIHRGGRTGARTAASTPSSTSTRETAGVRFAAALVKAALLTQSAVTKVLLSLTACVTVDIGAEAQLRLFIAAEAVRCYAWWQLLLGALVVVVVLPYPLLLWRLRAWAQRVVDAVDRGVDGDAGNDAGDGADRGERRGGCRGAKLAAARGAVTMLGAPYVRGREAWDAVFALRLLLLIAAGSVLQGAPVWRAVVMELLLIAFLCVNVAARPFASRVDAACDLLASSATVVLGVLRVHEATLVEAGPLAHDSAPQAMLALETVAIAVPAVVCGLVIAQVRITRTAQCAVMCCRMCTQRGDAEPLAAGDAAKEAPASAARVGEPRAAALLGSKSDGAAGEGGGPAVPRRTSRGASLLEMERNPARRASRAAAAAASADAAKRDEGSGGSYVLMRE